MAAFRSPVCFMIFWSDSLPTALLYITLLLPSQISRPLSFPWVFLDIAVFLHFPFKWVLFLVFSPESYGTPEAVSAPLWCLFRLGHSKECFLYVCNKHPFTLSKNTVDISQNKADISKNRVDISQNKFDISKNKFDISQNRLDISQNTFNISENKFDIWYIIK